MAELIRLAVRGFAGKRIVFEDRIDVSPADFDSVVRTRAEDHARKMAAHGLHMIEIEFLDERNEDERFYRFGTDPSGMVMPVQVALGGEDPNQ